MCCEVVLVLAEVRTLLEILPEREDDLGQVRDELLQVLGEMDMTLDVFDSVVGRPVLQLAELLLRGPPAFAAADEAPELSLFAAELALSQLELGADALCLLQEDRDLSSVLIVLDAADLEVVDRNDDEGLLRHSVVVDQAAELVGVLRLADCW